MKSVPTCIFSTYLFFMYLLLITNFIWHIHVWHTSFKDQLFVKFSLDVKCEEWWCRIRQLHVTCSIKIHFMGGIICSRCKHCDVWDCFLFIGQSQDSEKKEVKEEDFPTLEEASLAARGIKTTTGKSSILSFYQSQVLLCWFLTLFLVTWNSYCRFFCQNSEMGSKVYFQTKNKLSTMYLGSLGNIVRIWRTNNGTKRGTIRDSFACTICSLKCYRRSLVQYVINAQAWDT